MRAIKTRASVPALRERLHAPRVQLMQSPQSLYVSCRNAIVGRHGMRKKRMAYLLQSVARMSTISVAGLLSVLVLSGAGCKHAPSACADVSADGAKKAGIVLPDSHVCKDDGLVATLEFPNAKKGEVMGLYTKKLVADGYTEQKLDDRISMFTKGTSLAAFVTSGDASQQKDMPFAVIRYCSTPECVTDTQQLADAFKKAKAETK